MSNVQKSSEGRTPRGPFTPIRTMSSNAVALGTSDAGLWVWETNKWGLTEPVFQ